MTEAVGNPHPASPADPTSRYPDPGRPRRTWSSHGISACFQIYKKSK
jgi:hypothetical protein